MTVAKKLEFNANAPELTGFANITTLPVVPPSKSPVRRYLPAARRSYFLKRFAVNTVSV